MNSFTDILEARLFLAVEHPDRSERCREKMLSVYLLTRAAIQHGLDGNRAVVAVCLAAQTNAADGTPERAKRLIDASYPALPSALRQQMVEPLQGAWAAISGGLSPDDAVCAACTAHKSLLDEEKAA